MRERCRRLHTVLPKTLQCFHASGSLPIVGLCVFAVPAGLASFSC